MAETEIKVGGQIIYDARPGERDFNVDEHQKKRTKGWQVVSIPEQVPTGPDPESYIRLTDNRYAHTVINVYQPGQKDEMHCHPGSEHIFLVFEGELTIRGINEGEEIKLKPGEFVHINAGHYYQLANETDEPTVLYQVATVPVKKSPVERRSFRRAGDKTADDLLPEQRMG